MLLGASKTNIEDTCEREVIMQARVETMDRDESFYCKTSRLTDISITVHINSVASFSGQSMEEIVQAIKESLLKITNRRFYETERGFQGEFGSELRLRLPGLELKGAIVEQEYQKRIPDHGFQIRPDLIIHIPFEETEHSSRSEGNFAVIEFKRRASRMNAKADYENLHKMCEKLGYPLAVFINIDSEETYIEECIQPSHAKIYAFSVVLKDAKVHLNEQVGA